MDKEKESENLQLSSDEVAMRVGLLTDLLQCGTQMVVSTYTRTAYHNDEVRTDVERHLRAG